MEGYGVGGLRNQISVKLSDEDYDQLAVFSEPAVKGRSSFTPGTGWTR